MFDFLRKKKQQFFPDGDQEKIVAAIRESEIKTSGEVRVFVESKCRFVDPLDRAKEIFFNLEMDATKQKNAVLVYVAMKDKQLAVFADEGIYIKAGKDFWYHEVQKMLNQFNSSNYAEGIANVVKEIGAALAYHFPYDAATDKNELPDEIVFGK